MHHHNWKTEILRIPNLLSLLRILLIPVYMTLYLRAQKPWDYFLSGFVLALSCLTDFLDGWAARRFRMITNLGKILDPLADKLTQLSLSICLSFRYPIMGTVLMLFLFKECFQLAAALWHFRRGKVLPGALRAGKVSTAVFFVTLILLVLFPKIPLRWVRGFAALDCVFLTISFISYGFAYLGRNPRLENWQ